MSFSATNGYLTKPKPGVMINPLHPLSRGLVGYWLFSEGAGSRAYDISGHGNHGTLTNMSPNAQNSGWGGSKFAGGLNFDGSDDCVDCGSSENLNITGAFTVSARFFFTNDWLPDNNQYTAIVVKDTVFASGYGLQIYERSTDNTVRLEVWVRGVSLKSAWTDIYGIAEKYTWYQATGVYDGTNLYIYRWYKKGNCGWC